MNFEERTAVELFLIDLKSLERALDIEQRCLGDSSLSFEYAETMNDLIHLFFDANITPACEQLAAFVDESAHAEMEARG